MCVCVCVCVCVYVCMYVCMYVCVRILASSPFYIHFDVNHRKIACISRPRRFWSPTPAVMPSATINCPYYQVPECAYGGIAIHNCIDPTKPQDFTYLFQGSVLIASHLSTPRCFLPVSSRLLSSPLPTPYQPLFVYLIVLLLFLMLLL